MPFFGPAKMCPTGLSCANLNLAIRHAGWTADEGGGEGEVRPTTCYETMNALAMTSLCVCIWVGTAGLRTKAVRA